MFTLVEAVFGNRQVWTHVRQGGATRQGLADTHFLLAPTFHGRFGCFAQLSANVPEADFALSLKGAGAFFVLLFCGTFGGP